MLTRRRSMPGRHRLLGARLYELRARIARAGRALRRRRGGHRPRAPAAGDRRQRQFGSRGVRPRGDRPGARAICTAARETRRGALADAEAGSRATAGRSCGSACGSRPRPAEPDPGARRRADGARPTALAAPQPASARLPGAGRAPRRRAERPRLGAAVDGLRARPAIRICWPTRCCARPRPRAARRPRRRRGSAGRGDRARRRRSGAGAAARRGALARAPRPASGPAEGAGGTTRSG